MAKRPSGFGKATKLKKQRTTEEASEARAETPEEEPEVNIELHDDTNDEELAEIYGLYTKLREERDPKFARGLIHECDQLLRSRDAKGESLPAKFHVVYGSALLTLADPQLKEKEAKDLGNAGLERLEIGVDSCDKTAADVRALAAAELIQYVHTQITDGSLSGSNRKLVIKAKSLMKSKDASVELARAGTALLQLADDCPEDSGLLESAKKVLENQLSSEDKEVVRVAHEGLGQYYLIVIAPEMDALDAEDGNDEDESAEASEGLTRDLKAGIEHLKQAVTEEKPNTLVMLAETLLQWATFAGDEEEKTYEEALKLLKKAQMLGADGLHEVIDSLENPDA